MSVIVTDDLAIDHALRMLWREANREGVIEKVRDSRYYVKPTSIKHEAKKVWAKTKSRRRRRTRQFKEKGWNYL